MKTVSVAEMVHIDELTIEEDFVPGAFLMDRAGEQLSLEIRKVYKYLAVKPDRVVFFAGKGNNGGDSFVAARYLAGYGIACDIFLAESTNKIGGDAHFYLQKIADNDLIKLHAYVKEVEELPLFNSSRPGAMLVVDALLGTGLKGEPRGVYKDAIELINKLGKSNYVISVDIPSGLSGDTGESYGVAVKADLTVSMAFPKKGFVESAALEYVGRVEVMNIGMTRLPAIRPEKATEFLSRQDISVMFKRRNRTSHKGDYGKVLIIGGSKGFSGAPALSASAALKSGAGLVSVLVPESVASSVASICPEAMVHWGKEENGILARDALEKSLLSPDNFDVVLIGPGMQVSEQTRVLLADVIQKSEVPVILDADALNIVAEDASILRGDQQYVLTPHAGEMSRLIEQAVDEVRRRRFSAVMTAVHKYKSNIILKGAGTIIALKNADQRYVNLNGNPGMATAGSGDVLGGVLAGLTPQIGFENAICASVFIHGLAGDIAALKYGQLSMTATSIVECISDAICEL